MRHWNDRYAKRDRQPCSAGLVVCTRAGADTRPLRVDDDPETLREPLATLFGDLLHRILARLAIDDDRRGERERPAEERNRQQLFLGDERERRKQEIERQRLPGRRMLGHHDVRAVARRNILSADDAVPDAADNSRGGEIERAPPGDELEARHWRKAEREQ